MAKTETTGAMNRWMQVLRLEKTKTGWVWGEERGTWAGLSLGTEKNLFSRVGLGARNCTMHLRAQRLSLDQALKWGTQHIFLTSIQPGEDRGHLLVQGAFVELADCAASTPHSPDGETFPAVLTEKYLAHEQMNPYAVNRLTYVLVTPKVIVLQRGGIVAVNGIRYEVQVAHSLDPHKNEYEIFRTDEL